MVNTFDTMWSVCFRGSGICCTTHWATRPSAKACPLGWRSARRSDSFKRQGKTCIYNHFGGPNPMFGLETSFRWPLRSTFASEEPLRNSNSTTDELWSCLADASGEPVAEMMSSWTKNSGFPMLEVNLRASTALKNRRREALSGWNSPFQLPF